MEVTGPHDCGPVKRLRRRFEVRLWRVRGNRRRCPIETLQEGAQDYLIKGEISSRALQRSLRYAIERKNL